MSPSIFLQNSGQLGQDRGEQPYKPCGRRERVDWCRSGQISDAERNRGTSSLGFRVECSA